MYKNTVKIVTWYVRSLYRTTKLANVDEEMDRMEIKILGLSEVRWPGAGMHKTQNSVMCYPGGDDTEYQYGVPMLISSELEVSISDFVPLGDPSICSNW